MQRGIQHSAVVRHPLDQSAVLLPYSILQTKVRILLCTKLLPPPPPKGVPMHEGVGVGVGGGGLEKFIGESFCLPKR